MIFDLPVSHLQITLQAKQMIVLPPFAGSKYHGAFGESCPAPANLPRAIARYAPSALTQRCTPHGYPPT